MGGWEKEKEGGREDQGQEERQGSPAEEADEEARAGVSAVEGGTRR